MASRDTRISLTVVGAILSFVILFAFQNCAPPKSVGADGLVNSATYTPPPSTAGFAGLPPSLPPTNGACPATLTLNACAPGSTFVDRPDSTPGMAEWSCNGSNGGSNVNCSMPVYTSNYPVCGFDRETCTPGVVANVQETSTQYTWTCSRNNQTLACAINKTPGGGGGPTCGPRENCINGGIYSNDTDTETMYKWFCSGTPCSAPKDGADITCNATVEPLSHFGDGYTYRVTPPEGISFPPVVNYKINGTKTIGGVQVTDEPGTTVVPITNSQFPRLYNDNTNKAGFYIRSFTLYNPDNNQIICKTKSVTQTLTPQCILTANAATYTYAQNPVLNVNLATTPALFGSPTAILWNTTKNGTPDAIDQNLGFLSTFTITLGSTANIGTYTRYIKALDRNGLVLCKSNVITTTITNVAAAQTQPPPPVTAPTPNPTPPPVASPDPLPSPNPINPRVPIGCLARRMNCEIP